MPGSGEELNQSLEKAGRVADFLEFAELMCLDALQRNESCGGHFREEYQTRRRSAARRRELRYVAAWEYAGDGQAAGAATRSRCVFENVQSRAAELQVMKLTLHVWRQNERRSTQGGIVQYELPT